MEERSPGKTTMRITFVGAADDGVVAVAAAAVVGAVERSQKGQATPRRRRLPQSGTQAVPTSWVPSAHVSDAVQYPSTKVVPVPHSPEEIELEPVVVLDSAAVVLAAVESVPVDEEVGSSVVLAVEGTEVAATVESAVGAGVGARVGSAGVGNEVTGAGVGAGVGSGGLGAEVMGAGVGARVGSAGVGNEVTGAVVLSTSQGSLTERPRLALAASWRIWYSNQCPASGAKGSVAVRVPRLSVDPHMPS